MSEKSPYKEAGISRMSLTNGPKPFRKRVDDRGLWDRTKTRGTGHLWEPYNVDDTAFRETSKCRLCGKPRGLFRTKPCRGRRR